MQIVFDVLVAKLKCLEKKVLFSFHIGYAGEYYKIHAALCLVFLA